MSDAYTQALNKFLIEDEELRSTIEQRPDFQELLIDLATEADELGRLRKAYAEYQAGLQNAETIFADVMGKYPGSRKVN